MESKKIEEIYASTDTGELWVCPVCGRRFWLLHEESSGGRTTHRVKREVGRHG